IDGVIAIDKFPETQLYDPGLGTSLRNHPLKDGWYDDYEPQVRPRVEMMQGAVQFQQRMSIQVIQAVQNDHLAVLLIDDLADVDIILPFGFSRFEKRGRLPVHVPISGIEGLGFRVNRQGMIDHMGHGKAMLEVNAACAARTIGKPVDPRCGDRKSTRLNSSHVKISYAVF